MTTTHTVKFNVGGRHFEVSRDLMEKHFETMLGRLVSEAWQQDPEEPVFIDRNGDTFAYVLDYLRYGSIELPHTVPRSSFERDLDFYGLIPEEEEIKENSFADIIASLREDRDNSKRKFEMFVFAAEVNHQYTMKKVMSKKLVTISEREILTNKDLAEDHKLFTEPDRNVFLTYLDVYYGLRMPTWNECEIGGSPYFSRESHLRADGYFYVTRK